MKRAESVRLTPLSPEEQQYAADNHDTLVWCMRVLRIPKDDYGTAALGFLQAVKKWHARPDLHSQSFRTVAKWSVSRQVCNARRKESREIRTVSLDAVVPGTDSLTYGSTVTYKNMEYLSGKEDTGMAMKMNYDVAIPAAAKLGRTPSVEIEKLAEFLDSGHKTMSFEYTEAKEAASKCSTLRSWKKKNQRTDFEIYKMAGTIYVEKAKTKAGRKQ